MLDTYMTKFQEEMGIKSSLQSETPGVYLIPLEENLSIRISSLGNGISLNCNMINCPKEHEEELYAHALLANLFGQGTGGAVIGLSENGNILTLSRDIDYTIEYKEFKDFLEEFINTVNFWRQEALIP